MAILERLIQHIQKFKDVWFASQEDVARYVKRGMEE
jgi:hypothetical protein